MVTIESIGRQMCEGEYESLKALYEVSPSFVPKPYAWGKCKNDPETYFLLAEFRDIGRQVCWMLESILPHLGRIYACPLCVIQQSMLG